MTGQRAITIVYEHGSQQPGPRMVTPRLVLEAKGMAYVVAHCHLDECEKAFRLDRIRSVGLTKVNKDKLPL
jgi:predicted DNA-binding transcriptional regulator YafY